MSRPDQSNVESRLEAEPNDEDSVMEDATINDNPDTPQTISTRASTPTDSRAENVPNNDLAFKPSENDDDADDVTMKNLDQEVRSTTQAADDLGTSQPASWPPFASIDRGSTPGQAGQSKWKPVNYEAEPQNLEELVQADDVYSTNLYGR